MLDKFEKKITDAETLLEVFDVMKEMFEILMLQIGQQTTNKSGRINFSEMGEEEQNEKENLEKVLQKYQTEIKTHIKTEKELEKMVIEMNSKLEKTCDTLKSRDEYILVCRLLSQKLEKDCENLVKRNDELETANIDLKKSLDVLLQQKVGEKLSTGGVNASMQSRKNSKSKSKKITPRSPLQPNRILRSYNSINQVNCISFPFSKSALNKTLNPRLTKKSVVVPAPVNCSMNDVTNKSIANCMINNVYFIPKTLKAKVRSDGTKPPTKRRSLSKFKNSVERSLFKPEPRQPKSSKLTKLQHQGTTTALIDKIFMNADQRVEVGTKFRTSSVC